MKDMMILLVFFVIVVVIIILLVPKKDGYQIIDVVKDVCKIECLNRGYTGYQCINDNFYFMKNCSGYMIDLIGPLPKSGVHLEDIYASTHTPQ